LLAGQPHLADSQPDRPSIIGKEALIADHHPAPAEAAAGPAALPGGDHALAAAAAPQQLITAHGVTMPSAELLLAAGLAAEDGDHAAPRLTAEVAQALADALAGHGSGQPIDALLDALPDHGAAAPALDQLATGNGAGFDIGHAAGFADTGFLAGLHGLIASHALPHPDATAAV